MKKLLMMATMLALVFGDTLGCKKHDAASGSAGQGQAPMFTQSYSIDAKAFVANLRRIATPKERESNQELLLRFFKENNVAMDPPAALLVDENGNRLLIRAPESEKARIQTLFQKIQRGQ